MARKAAFEIDDDEWQRFFEVNVMSGIRFTRHYAPGHGQARLGPRRLRVERIGAQHSKEMIHYGMSRPRSSPSRAALPWSWPAPASP